jgi:hypothetical protein
MQQKQLFVSFWDLCLDNLTEGAFTHRRLSPEQAKILIEQAQQDKTICCVSQDDLLAPYNKQEALKYQELCTALEQHYGIHFIMKDFLLKDEEDELFMTMPLQIAQVQGEAKLMVINCAYSFNSDRRNQNEDEDEDTSDIDRLFAIAPDSIQFHLLEAIDP